MRKLLFIVVVLIVYGSLYPWRFHHAALPANPLWILLHSWEVGPAVFFYRDTAVNIALYVPFGLLGFLWLSERRSGLFATAATLLGAALLSACVEMTQLFVPQRLCSMLDVTCNVAGAAAGIALGGVFPKAVRRIVSGIEAAGAFRLSGAVVLLYLWLGYQLFPFFPALGRTVVRHKLGILLTPDGWAARDFLEGSGGWLAFSALLEDLVGPRVIWILPVALLFIPLKLLLAGRSMSGSELIGALAGIACWILFSRLLFKGAPRGTNLAAGAVAVACLVAGGLIPFHFAPGLAQSFTWIPFLPMLQTPWDAAFVILFRKSFLYGSAIWLLKDNGHRWTRATMTVAILLAAVEALQVFLPGRTPEVTDPLLALLLGFGLMLLDRKRPEQEA